jgi:hypothetical protein
LTEMLQLGDLPEQKDIGDSGYNCKLISLL